MNNSKTFQLHRHLAARLDKHFEIYKKEQRFYGRRVTLSSYVNNLISAALDREVVLSKYAPAFKVVGVLDHTLHIRDTNSQRTYSIQRLDHQLRCVEDSSHNCSHVMFAIATDAIAMLFKDGENDADDMPSIEGPIKN